MVLGHMVYATQEEMKKFYEKAMVKHSPSKRCKREYTQKWCKLANNQLMPRLHAVRVCFPSPGTVSFPVPACFLPGTRCVCSNTLLVALKPVSPCA